MTREARDRLLEAASSSYREVQMSKRIVPAPEWADLPATERAELFDRQFFSRELERARHARGWSGTVRAVVARIQGGDS